MYTQHPDLKDLPDPYLPAQKALITHVDRRLEAKARRRIALEKFERDLAEQDRKDRRFFWVCIIILLSSPAVVWWLTA
jgi:hypothetical protein